MWRSVDAIINIESKYFLTLYENAKVFVHIKFYLQGVLGLDFQ